MHKWHVTVQLTYTTEVWTEEPDMLTAQEFAIEAEDPDYDPPHITQCIYLGEVDNEAQA